MASLIHRNTVGDCTDQQPFTFLSRRTGDQASIGVDGDDPNNRARHRRLGPAQGEIQRFAEKHYEIGLPHYVRKCPDGGVGDAARTF